jgi:hypothetical protein
MAALADRAARRLVALRGSIERTRSRRGQDLAQYRDNGDGGALRISGGKHGRAVLGGKMNHLSELFWEKVIFGLFCLCVFALLVAGVRSERAQDKPPAAGVQAKQLPVPVPGPGHITLQGDGSGITSNAQMMTPGSMVVFSDYKTTTGGTLEIDGPTGTMLIKISFTDGTVTYGKNYTPDAAGKAFWEAIAYQYPCTKSKGEK